MGISNSIGSNVFDVLLCLGLPWFLKAALFPKTPGDHYVTINSQGLVYNSISLFSTLTVLYLSLLIGKFKLTRSIGIVCLIMYVIFLVFASILELNLFFVVNLPICVHWYFIHMFVNPLTIYLYRPSFTKGFGTLNQALLLSPFDILIRTMNRWNINWILVSQWMYRACRK